jgi:Antibiotic biosynthesis monooxygenase
VTYVFIAIHYPAPGRGDEVYQRMLAMASGAVGTPGLLEIGPWHEYDGDRVVGFSRWESRRAFEAAMPGSGVPNDLIHDGERRPRDYLHLIGDIAVTR